MVAAVAALWVLWWRNTRRQRRIEAMLAGSSRQLHEATLLLEQAMSHIEAAKERETGADQTRQIRDAPKTASRQQSSAEKCRLIPEMERAGKSQEEIARELNMPLGQVRLLSRLYAIRND